MHNQNTSMNADIFYVYVFFFILAQNSYFHVWNSHYYITQ
jgi:hypothetical protein